MHTHSARSDARTLGVPASFSACGVHAAETLACFYNIGGALLSGQGGHAVVSNSLPQGLARRTLACFPESMRALHACMPCLHACRKPLGNLPPARLVTRAPRPRRAPPLFASRFWRWPRVGASGRNAKTLDKPRASISSARRSHACAQFSTPFVHWPESWILECWPRSHAVAFHSFIHFSTTSAQNTRIPLSARSSAAL
jgi:hypothetical protein